MNTRKKRRPRAAAAPRAVEGPGAGFPVVGIGASAGGLAAFEAFLSSMPSDADSNMAFVLIQHLAPTHKSILTDLIRRYTKMQVFEVKDGMAVRPNCAYIIPPNCDMAFLNGALHLLEPAAPHGQRLPIDFFFRSLAQDQHERAIGIVLSGTGSDGTLGVRAIKGEGGMVMAQKPESTEYDGMPNSAIATSLVDFVLTPAEMPAKLIAYAAHALGKAHIAAAAPPKEDAMTKVFILLRAQTGHDFSHYKRNTIVRRVERRMAIHQINELGGYVRFLQKTPDEVEALFRDLLIGVTSFFRDPGCFKALQEQVIARLFAGKSPAASIRVWVPGCSTGEEAYSIAILLQERLGELKQGLKVQVFATDIDSRAIAQARVGAYPANIVADVSPHRLARFFVKEPGGGYRVHKGIRDMVVFSEQDVLKDPPFSKLDLLSCRNLLIYMDGVLQKKLIPLFHYALNPDGSLFLGSAETVGEFDDLFAAQDRKAKLYRRKPSGRPALGLPLVAPQEIGGGRAPRRLAKAPGAEDGPLRELTERALLQQHASVAVLVDEHGDILYIHGRSGRYLEPAPGEAGTNILKMSREGLRGELAAALRKAAAQTEPVCRAGLRVKTNGDFSATDMTVRRVADATAGPAMFLVILEEAPPPERKAVGGSGKAAPESARIKALKAELRDKEEYLQSAAEELASGNEELQSSNEEMQSVNEELQSTNEELETAKEELQSVNEELSTVNSELQTKVADLTQANNDLNNLMAGTGVGTIFVDSQLRILRFTPAATKVVNLIPTDVGRPVGHIVSNLAGYDRLVEDAQVVLDTLAPKDVEVRSKEGVWFQLRIRPYRTLENVIEGAVITFVEITEIKCAQDAMRRLAVVVQDATDAILVRDMAGLILAWNPAAERLYGWTEAEALAMSIHDMTPEGLREEALARELQLGRDKVLKPYRTQRLSKGGRTVEVWLTATALKDEAGKIYAIATTERAPEAAPKIRG